MNGQFLRAGKKSCSCRNGKNCAACKAKKHIPPQVIVEEPRRLPAPVTVTYFKPQQKSVKSTPTTVHFVEKSGRWGARKGQTYEAPPKKKTGIIRRWYEQRKALKEIKKHQKYESKRLKQLIEWEEARERAQSVPPQEKKWIVDKPKKYKTWPSLIRRNKLLRIKEKSATVKPKAQSKYVNVKKSKPTEPMSDRCARCFYRFCCKFYCYLNCIILLIVIVIFVL